MVNINTKTLCQYYIMFMKYLRNKPNYWLLLKLITIHPFLIRFLNSIFHFKTLLLLILHILLRNFPYKQFYNCNYVCIYLLFCVYLSTLFHMPISNNSHLQYYCKWLLQVKFSVLLILSSNYLEQILNALFFLESQAIKNKDQNLMLPTL